MKELNEFRRFNLINKKVCYQKFGNTLILLSTISKVISCIIIYKNIAAKEYIYKETLTIKLRLKKFNIIEDSTKLQKNIHMCRT